MPQYLSEQQQRELDDANNTIYQLKHDPQYKTNPEYRYVYHSKPENPENKTKICIQGYNRPNMNSNPKKFDEKQLLCLQDMVGNTYSVEKFIEKLQNTTNIYNLHKFSVDDLQSLTKAYFTKQHLKRLITAQKQQ